MGETQSAKLTRLPTPAPDAETRDVVRLGIVAAVEKHTANVVARALGIDRSTLLSWMVGCSREATDTHVRSRAPRLASLPKT